MEREEETLLIIILYITLVPMLSSEAAHFRGLSCQRSVYEKSYVTKIHQDEATTLYLDIPVCVKTILPQTDLTFLTVLSAQMGFLKEIFLSCWVGDNI